MKLRYYVKVMIDDGSNTVITKFLSYLEKAEVSNNRDYLSVIFEVQKHKYLNDLFDDYIIFVNKLNNIRINNLNEYGMNATTKMIKTEVFNWI